MPVTTGVDAGLVPKGGGVVTLPKPPEVVVGAGAHVMVMAGDAAAPLELVQLQVPGCDSLVMGEMNISRVALFSICHRPALA